MKSQEMIDILKSVIFTDLNSQGSVINYFLTHQMSGGWEAWLQVQYARAVVNSAFQNRPNVYDREKNFGVGNGQKCDLWFKAQADIWVELKTQRDQVYANAAPDFIADISKLWRLPNNFRRDNVLIAAVALNLGQHGIFNPVDDRNVLNSIKTGGPAGELKVWVYEPQRGWIDSSANILSIPLGKGVLATFVLA